MKFRAQGGSLEVRVEQRRKGILKPGISIISRFKSRLADFAFRGFQKLDVVAVSQFRFHAVLAGNFTETEIGVIQQGERLIRSAEHVRTHTENTFLRGGKRMFAFLADFVKRAFVKCQHRRIAVMFKDLFVHRNQLRLEPGAFAADFGMFCADAVETRPVCGISGILVRLQMRINIETLQHKPEFVIRLKRRKQSLRAFGKTPLELQERLHSVVDFRKILFPLGVVGIKPGKIPCHVPVDFIARLCRMIHYFTVFR